MYLYHKAISISHTQTWYTILCTITVSYKTSPLLQKLEIIEFAYVPLISYVSVAWRQLFKGKQVAFMLKHKTILFDKYCEVMLHCLFLTVNNQMWGAVWPAEELSDSQGGLWFTELVSSDTGVAFSGKQLIRATRGTHCPFKKWNQNNAQHNYNNTAL